MRLADVAACADEVAATASRNGKIEVLAALLRQAEPRQAAVAAQLLAGDPRQGRVGVGWATAAALRTSPATSPSLTVDDLDGMLDAVAASGGEGAAQTRVEIVDGLLSRATAAEADFVRRLLVGELRQGASEGVVVEAVARAAGVSGASVRRALMLTGDLGETVAVALAEGSSGLESVRFRLMRPVRPMLASTAANAGSAVSELGLCSVEWKLDGVRIQVHRHGDKVRIWTRNLNDVTGRLGEVVETVRGLTAADLALDGEVVGVGDDLSPAMFQDTMGRVGTTEIGHSGIEVIPTGSADSESGLRLAAVFFDVLHVDGRDLLDEPLAVRLEHLDAIALGHRVPGVVTDDPDEAERVFAAAVDAGHEGVMVKAAGAPYAAGRRGKAWRKVKPVHRFDLVVLAVEPGSGRRRGWLSNIHLGARDPDGGFVMVGKTFKGMTDAMLEWQTRRFGELAVDRHRHIVELRPEQVVEVAVDGVQRSSRYPGGVALRFARVVRYRSDKAAHEADTIDAVRGLMSRQRGSIGSKP